MKMFNVIKYRFLYIFTLTLTLFWSRPAHAGWLGDLWEDIKQAAKEIAARLLGIDISDNCTVPSFVTGSVDTNVNCLFCGMFKAIFNAGSLVAGKAYTSFSEDLGKLLLIFLAVSLALIVLKNLSSMGGTDTASIVNEILQKTFIGAVMFLIISGEYFPVINMTIVPIYQSGLGLFGTSNCSQASGIIGFSETFVAGDTVTGGLPYSLGASVVCTVKDLESKVSALFDLGDWAFCRGWGPDRVFIVLPNLIHLIDGILFYLCGLVLMVMYPWVLTDAVFQLALAFILLPFAICGYAFQGTKKYLPDVFNWVVNSLIIFIFMHILLMCLNEYLRSIILEALENSGGDARVLFTHPIRGIAFYGIGAVKIIFIVYLIYEYIPVVKELGDNFSSGAGLSVGKAADTFMRKQVAKQGEKLGKKTLEGTKNTLKWGWNRATGLNRRVAMRFGEAPAGRYYGDTHFLTHSTSAGKYLQKTKTYDGRNVKEKVFTDKFSEIKMLYDKSGNLVGQHVEFRDSFAKNMIDGKGRIDKAALQALLDSPLAQDPACRQAIMEQIATDALEAHGKKLGKNFNSRNVTFNPSNPYEILIEQVDHSGRITKVQMKIDPITGQVALAHGTNHTDSGRFDVFFTNGATEFTTNGTMDKTGTVTSEVTKCKFGAHIQKGHDSILDRVGDNKVIDERGNIAKDIAPAELLFGLDDMFGVSSVGGTSMKDYVKDNILTESSKQRTNRVHTNMAKSLL